MARRGVVARSMAELLRDIQERIRRLETRAHVTVGTGEGMYVLRVDAAGRLVARHAASGTETVIASP